MIAEKEILTESDYDRCGGARGLQEDYLSGVLDAIKNKEIAPLAIFSLCDPAKGSVMLRAGDMARIAQISGKAMTEAVDDFVNIGLIKPAATGLYRLVHEFIGKLFQEQGSKFISPTELVEFQVRRDKLVSQGIDELDKMKVIPKEPSIESRISGACVWVEYCHIALEVL